MNRRVLPLIIGSLLLPLGCGGPTGPFSTLSVTTESLPNAPPTVAYNETLVATGGDGSYTWSLTVGSLPAGLSLNTSTSDITGTPTGASSTFTVQVVSGDGQTDTQPLRITVALHPNDLCSDYPASAVATFEDDKLREVIMELLGVGGSGDLTCGLISGLTDLSIRNIVSVCCVPVRSIRGIQNLTGLTRLSLYNIPGGSPTFRVLSGLTSLTTLQLAANSITDISGLSELTSLTELDLSHNSIIDFRALSGLTSLTTLNLSSNPITHISALSGLTGLTELNLSFGNSITDFRALSGLTSLTVLNLSGNSITDISGLSGLTSLTDLNLSNNLIADFSPLSGLTSLTTLRLVRNSVTGISGLSGLTSLTVLDLSNNLITDATLSGLTSLTDLDLSRNSITDISGLSGLTGLTELDLSRNSITDISGLSGLTSLTDLNLSLNSNLNNIQPLLDNTIGFGAGDRVFLLRTMVSCTDVALLEAKGVTVQHSCF